MVPHQLRVISFRPAAMVEGVPVGHIATAGSLGGLGDLGGSPLSGFLDDLGNFFTAPIRAVTSFATDAADILTGSKAQREAQQRAIELAKVQAEAEKAAGEARTRAISSAMGVAPWLAIGAGAIGVAIVISAALKR